MFKLNYENQNQEKNKGLILPVHSNFFDKIPFKELFRYKELIDGYLLITENYWEMNFEKMQALKEQIAEKLDCCIPSVKYGDGHPSKVFKNSFSLILFLMKN